LARDHQITLVIIEHIFQIPRLLDRVDTVWTLEHGDIRVQTPSEVRQELIEAGSDGLKEWLLELAGTAGRVVNHELCGGAVLTTVSPTESRGKPLLEISQLVVRRGNRIVLGRDENGKGDALSFSICEGELAVLHAPNGWGKTTLLEAIAGLLPVEAGNIAFDGRPINIFAAWERTRLGLSLLQAQNHMYPELTVREGLRLARIEKVPDSLKPFAHRKMSDLSGGEKQRAAFACAYGPKQPRLMLLDEPFSMLDRNAIREVQQRLRPDSRSAVLIAVPGIYTGTSNRGEP